MVAHSMGVIAVQAGVGAHVIDTDPAEAKKSLEAISTTSRSTLTEIRRMLGVLREDDGRASTRPRPASPISTRLVRDVRGAGVDVDVHVGGRRRRACRPAVDFTAYRIVQEALTNVLKHAGPAHVRRHRRLRAGRAARSRSPTTAAASTVGATDGGHGLIGMRERVAVYGGTFEPGPRPAAASASPPRFPTGRLT